MAFADRDRGQIDAMGDIPDRVDVRHRGLRETIDRYAAIAGIDGNAGILQADIGDVGMPSDRKHHQIRADAGTIRQVRGEFLAVLVDLVDRAAGENGDAFLFHLGAHMRADVLVEAAQDVVAAIISVTSVPNRQRCRQIPVRYNRRPESQCARQRRQMKHFVR